MYKPQVLDKVLRPMDGWLSSPRLRDGRYCWRNLRRSATSGSPVGIRFEPLAPFVIGRSCDKVSGILYREPIIHANAARLPLLILA